jgi:WD40 repeat protein/energy-coupling factor transporter ATP-binding protein EcfA2
MARRYALVIGISHYEKPLLPLTKTVSDATAIAQRLRESGEFQDVVTLTQQPVTANQLDQALETFLLHQATGQDALIYFTGHGITATLGRQKMGVLATSDCLVNGKGDRVTVQVRSPDNDPVTFYRLNQLIREANLSSLVVWLDCCHSENLIESFITQDLLSHLKDLNRPDLFFITACRLHEQALARRSEAHSFFTGALLDALSPSNARDGIISCNDVFGALSNRLKGSGQEPRHMGYGGSIPILTIAHLSSPSNQSTVNLHNPYIGLTAFDQTTADLFYGRDTAVHELVACLSDRRVLTVIGPSGCGKSSLIKAGLLPQLRQGCLPDSRAWKIVSLRLGDQPLQKLQEVLATDATDSQPYMLFIDQFEELFTLCQNLKTQETFIRSLADTVEQSTHLMKVILAIRGDFLDRCAAIPASALLINRGTDLSPYLMTKLSSQEMVEAIEKPAKQHGVELEPGLVPQMIADVGDEPGSLPLLQFALTKLWETCIHSNSPPLLTWQGYAAIGGVSGALEQHADAVYQILHPSDRAFIRDTLVRELVAVPDNLDQAATRRRVRWERLKAIAPAEQVDRVLNRTLIPERLLVANEDTVEVAHEALLSKSKLLKTWIDNNREAIRLSHRLETDCAAWKAKQKSDAYLLPSGWLAAIQDWQTKSNPSLSPDEQEFLKKSLGKRDREVHFYQKVAIGGIIAALSIAGLSTVATTKWRDANQGQISALATSSEATVITNPMTLEALLEAVKAGEQFQQTGWMANAASLQSEVMDSLGQAIYLVREQNRLEGHSNYVQQVQFSPDNQLIATAGHDNVAKLWSISGQELQTLRGHTDGVTAVAFSLDSQTIATTSFDKTIKLWDRNGNLRLTLLGHMGPRSVSFSPDGTLIATAGDDRTIRLWSLDGKSQGTLTGHQGIIDRVVFSHNNSQLIATASRDNRAGLWNLKTGNVQFLKGHTKPIIGISFSPDDQLIATASNDQTVIVWDWATGTPKTTLKGHTDGVKDVSFSPDGQTVATASADGTVRLWSLDGTLLDTLKGHNARVNSVVFNQNGRTLASASNDKMIRLWQIKPSGLNVLGRYPEGVYNLSISRDGQLIAAASPNLIKIMQRDGKVIGECQEIGPVKAIEFSPDTKTVAIGSDTTLKLWDLQSKLIHTIGQHSKSIASLSFSPDGKEIAAADFAGEMKFWDLSGQLLYTNKVHDAEIYEIRFSPDGQKIATASWDKTVKIWKRDKILLQTLRGHEAPVYSVSFSPDSQQLATASEDNTVKIWNLDGQELQALKKHPAAVNAVAFSSTGQIATASNDGTIKLWNSQGQIITTLRGHSYEVNQVGFTPDNKFLVSASSDKTVLLWDIENLTLENLLRQGCNWLKNYLTHNPNAPEAMCAADKQ